MRKNKRKTGTTPNKKHYTEEYVKRLEIKLEDVERQYALLLKSRFENDDKIQKVKNILRSTKMPKKANSKVLHAQWLREVIWRILE